MLPVLIADVRARLAAATDDDAPVFAAALAKLEAEAARRGLQLPGVPEPSAAALAPIAVDQEAVRLQIGRAGVHRDLQAFALTLRHADPASLWCAFKWTRCFKDADERLLALEQVAYHLSFWLTSDREHADSMEHHRTQRLSEVTDPLAWIEQEVLRLFHHTLRFGGDPTASAIRAASVEDREED
jgi:hypothetical protein